MLHRTPTWSCLSYGLTNSLIRNIAGIPSLTVKRSPSNSPGKAVDPQSAGRQLRVDAIVTGSVSQRSGKLYITAELADVTSGAVLWAHRYEKDEADLALIQDEIASAIVDDGIRLKLSVDDRSRLVRRFTDDPEAYKLYMRATYLHTKEKEEDYLVARELLREAVNRDETFALAYVQLAYNHASTVVDGYENPNQNWPLVKKYARQALDLDPTLLEAHSRLGTEALLFKWDWESAQKEFSLGLQSPHTVNTAYTLGLWAVGRSDDALRVVRGDLNRNPLNLELRLREADLLLSLKQTEAAGDLYANIIRDEPADARAVFGLAEVRRAQGRPMRRSLNSGGGTKRPQETSRSRLHWRKPWRRQKA